MTAPTTPVIVELDEASRTLNAVHAWEKFPIRGAGDQLAETATILASAFIAIAADLAAARRELEHLSHYLADDSLTELDGRQLQALITAVREHHDDWHGPVPFRFCAYLMCHVAHGEL